MSIYPLKTSDCLKIGVSHSNLKAQGKKRDQGEEGRREGGQSAQRGRHGTATLGISVLCTFHSLYFIVKRSKNV